MLELSVSEHRICFASSSEAKNVVNELKGEQPLAILVPSNIDGQGEETHVLVEDPAGRMHCRRRFLFQLGSGQVTYMDGKPQKAIVADSAKVILTFAKQHTDAETLDYAMKNAKNWERNW